MFREGEEMDKMATGMDKKGQECSLFRKGEGIDKMATGMDKKGQECSGRMKD